jgi:signal transduction histidine kinase
VAADAERRAALETAQRAVRQRDDVLAVVSHDLRNMLNVFRLTAWALASELPEDAATARDLVPMLQSQADSMSRLVDDLVDVARVDAGMLRIVRTDCDVRTLAEDALRAVQLLAQQKGIALEVHLPETGALVTCARRRILQVFANLLGNAVKFTDKGAVRLEVSVEEREVRFSVSDTGAGISPEHLPHLFERHWQGRVGERSGAGLGLYIARGIVEAHGGRIWADSTQGKGTRISFTLARSQPAP